MLLAFAIGAGYTLELDLQEPWTPHPMAVQIVPLPGATGPAQMPGYYQQPPSALDPMPLPPGLYTDGEA
jgi:hypothetical protein